MSAGIRTNSGVGRELCGISTSSNQSVANNTVTKVTFTGVEHQVGSLTAVSSELVVVIPGVYLVTAGIFWDTTAASQRRQGFIETYTGSDPGVGSGTRLVTVEAPAATSYAGLSMSRTYLLAAGAKIRLGAYQTTGGALNIASSLSPGYLTAAKLA